MTDKTHIPATGPDRRPHVPIETLSIGEVFRLIESGESMTKPDADFTSLQESMLKKGKKKPAPELNI